MGLWRSCRKLLLIPPTQLYTTKMIYIFSRPPKKQDKQPALSPPNEFEVGISQKKTGTIENKRTIVIFQELWLPHLRVTFEFSGLFDSVFPAVRCKCHTMHAELGLQMKLKLTL